LSALRHFFVIEKGWKIVLDGNHDFGLEKVLGVEVITIIKGDALIPQISLASIHAKVTRDQYMEKQSEKFPAYGFEKHKGYGTLAHRAAIQKYGLCELHRETYCKNTRNIER
jgi:ribonuclease HII